MNWILDFVHKGGIFMYPIIACSVFALAIFMERLWATRRSVTMPEEFLKEVEEMLERREFSEAMAFVKRDGSVMGKILQRLLSNPLTTDNVRKNAEIAGKTQVANLYRGVETLATLASVATLLGLLGTISGMIKIFSAIYQKQFVNPADLAGGISEALYTTAAGLTVAIPTILAYRFISSRIDRIVVKLEDVLEKFVEIIERKEEIKSS